MGSKEKPVVEATEFYHDVEVFGGLRVLCIDDEPDNTESIPILACVYEQGSSHDILPLLKPAFISLLCDRLSLKYVHPSAEVEHKQWSRVVGAVMKASCAGYRRPRSKRS